jgi:hypothetical protein
MEPVLVYPSLELPISKNSITHASTKEGSLAVDISYPNFTIFGCCNYWVYQL